jgi:hypothetical protein
LKKVFKRLELTWVTFPLTVIGVSLIAYFTAYAVKGDDQRVNKLDIIDIDLHPGGEVHGNTWLTLFSPRVQAYTLGLAPAGGAWTAEGDGATTISLMEVGGDRPPGTRGLFTRPYEYAENATGMRKVPVPVWSTRSFSASWRAPLPKTAPLGIKDHFGKEPRAAKEGPGLIGKLTNNLGTELLDCTLFYRERWYPIGPLSPGASVSLEPLFAQDAQNRDLPSWFKDAPGAPGPLAPGDPLARDGQKINAEAKKRSAYRVAKQMMFFRAADAAGTTNAGVRRLDQTWRLRPLPEAPPPDRPRYRDEAILVARAPMLSDQADWVSAHPASPSRLWLGRLPEGKAEPPELNGFITQETFVRFYIPVK